MLFYLLEELFHVAYSQLLKQAKIVSVLQDDPEKNNLNNKFIETYDKFIYKLSANLSVCNIT